MNCYEKPFEIRVDEIDINGHLHHTKYLEYCSHTRYCQLHGRLVRSQAPSHRGPPPQLVAATDAIRSRDFIIL
jgi:acyl-CoA thioesterase FadM